MDSLFSPLKKEPQLTLQDQLCERISLQISKGLITPGQRLPSCRKLANRLGISRNTVVSAYQVLVYDSIVEAREKSGYFVHKHARALSTAPTEHTSKKIKNKNLFNHLRPNISPDDFNIIKRPHDWVKYPYPFVCNQIDAKRFPLANWRKCSADILSQSKSAQVISDYSYNDCDELLTEIRTRLLPSRGIIADKDEILLTAGTQQAIFLTAMLFGNSNRKIAIENPCYPDAKNIFNLFFNNVEHIKLDGEGMLCNDQLSQCDIAYVTPGHQYPTSIRMSPNRRKDLLASAQRNNIVIIEDDYDSKIDFSSVPTTALKADDTDNNVIYIGSLSKDLSPGIRIGYMVAPPDFIHEAKNLRGMMIRHLPPFLQLTAAHFIRLGHHDALINKLKRIYERRWSTAHHALHKNFPECEIISGEGGTNFIIITPYKYDFVPLAEQALKKGIVIDSLTRCFPDETDSYGMFRLGVSAIGIKQISKGIQLLRNVYDDFIQSNSN